MLPIYVVAVYTIRVEGPFWIPLPFNLVDAHAYITLLVSRVPLGFAVDRAARPVSAPRDTANHHAIRLAEGLQWRAH